jgi:hypothetical protein
MTNGIFVKKDELGLRTWALILLSPRIPEARERLLNRL